ncbi:arylacetamide deacetylase-like 4 [Eublepharis macularius]|uniref:Arylacetamide deacetylase-like 4 n=1 Tax=Eublepharis macularius TaxID=481883 RepID=A0AA97KMU7_EUBMA|nr:arylacetamide deacetylase-like 4 [Eublepharis macularius]
MGFLRVLLLTAGAVLTFPLWSLSLAAWVAYLYFFRSDFPPRLGHPLKIRLFQIGFLTAYGLGYIAWKIGLCGEHTVMRKLTDGIPPGKDKKLHIENLQFQGVPVRLYQTKALHSKQRKGMLFFHGGIGMWGSIDSHERMCRFFARESDSVVVSVGYRLSPEYPYPLQFKDCLDATIHFMKNAEDYGVDPKCVIIGGDSLGGTFAAATCQDLVKRTDLPKVRAQILLYPFLQAIDFNLPSHQQNRFVPPFFQRIIVEAGLQYLGKEKSLAKEIKNGSHIPEDVKMKLKNWINPDIIPQEFKHRGYKPPPQAVFSPEIHRQAQEAFETTFSPLIVDADVIRQLPEMYILTCEYDVFRDEGLLYKKRLEDEGVPVTWYHLADGFHGALISIDLPLFSFSCAKRGMDNIVDFIKRL